MNRILSFFVAFALPLFATAQIGTYTLDANTSTIGWLGKKVTGQHNGNVRFANGTVTTQGGKLTGATLEIDLNTITCTDITDKELNGKLIGHLKSDDFFGVANHPKAKLVVKKVEAGSAADSYVLVADVTIKGKTNEVRIPVTVKVKGKSLTATANFTLDRSKWDIRYGSKSFFNDLGDRMIYDDFELAINLTANQK